VLNPVTSCMYYKDIPVASQGLVWPGEATYGVTPIFPLNKNGDLFSHRYKVMTFFSCRTSCCLVFFVNSATKKFLSGVSVTPWMVSPGAVRPQVSLVTPLGNTQINHQLSCIVLLKQTHSMKVDLLKTSTMDAVSPLLSSDVYKHRIEPVIPWVLSDFSWTPRGRPYFRNVKLRPAITPLLPLPKTHEPWNLRATWSFWLWRIEWRDRHLCLVSKSDHA